MNRRILIIGIVCVVIAAFVIMFYPKPLPDLSLRMFIEPTNVEIGQYFEAEAWVRNRGKGKAGNFDVRVFFHSPFYDDYTLGDTSINGLKQDEEIKVFSRADLRLWDEGVHQIIIEVEPTDFTDKHDINNKKEYQITVVAPPKFPDLAIAAINIYPNQPQDNTYFYADVYIKNIGDAASGDYDVAIHIKDISRGYVYPIGTFRQGPMQPGEQYAVWSSDRVLVNDPGSFQLWVEIKPFLFDDKDDSNNIHGWAFTVKP